MNKPEPISPPRWLLRFFRWFCHPDYVEDIEGDLCERFACTVAAKSTRKARWRFLIEVLLLFRPGIIKPISYTPFFIPIGMFKHNLLITYRTFMRNKSSFLINLIGLSTGLAGVCLIYLWVHDEMGVDTFHKKDNQLYQVMAHFESPASISTGDATSGLLADALLEEIPEVEAVTMSNNEFFTPKGIVLAGEKSLAITGLFASKNYFEVFSYPLIQGDLKQVLAEKNNIVISQTLARKLYGSPAEAIGNTLEWQARFFKETFQISGVFADIPANSTAQFEAVILYDWLTNADHYAMDWSGTYAETYVLLKEGSDLQALNTKLIAFGEDGKRGLERFTLFFQKYSNRYLYDVYENGIQAGGRIDHVRMFSLIALLILIIACINFMNLATAQASKKMKEIGVKKAVGASRTALIVQFLFESIFIAVLSLIVAVALVAFLLPHFNHITAKQLQLIPNYPFMMAMVGIVLFTGFLAGSYPAFYLSGFKPLMVLKGKLNSSTGIPWLRRSLVVFQFTLSMIFIVGVLVINRQLQYTQNKNLGYDRSHVLCFQNPPSDADPQVFLSALKQIPGVVETSNMYWSVLTGYDANGGFSWRGVAEDQKRIIKSPRFGYRVVETLGLELIAGRSFSKDYHDDDTRIILNETALKMMQIEDPIGKSIKHGNSSVEIIGVVKDFQYGSLHQIIEPMVLRFRPYGRDVLVKIQANTEKSVIAQLEQKFKSFYPVHPFEFTFLDENYQRLYESETRVSILSKYFGSLAILISCLGLLGLTTFTAERRIKEISIRKVLGASIWRIVKLLSVDLTRMVLAAILISIPLSYLIMQKWLEGFAYKIHLDWWIFGIAALSVLLIAWLTIGIQTLKAASVNPAQCLRNE